MKMNSNIYFLSVTKHGLHVVLLFFPGGVTDEFTRKLQKWEEMKEKRSSGHFKGKRNNRLWMACTSLCHGVILLKLHIIQSTGRSTHNLLLYDP